MFALRSSLNVAHNLRCYSVSTRNPRHLLSIADLKPSELIALIRNAAMHKAAIKSCAQSSSFRTALQGRAVGMIFQKRSTRTRVSTEGAIVAMGGHPIFLGAADIQLGKSESLRDTSIVLSGMLSGITARVGPHRDIEELAKWSTVPVLNALSDRYHPFQAVTDLLTIVENRPSGGPGLGLENTKIAWIGDPTNVLIDLAIGAMKLGIHLAVATPEEYRIPDAIRTIIQNAADSSPHPGTLRETIVPEDAVKDACFLINDTWTSMGQEEEKAKRTKAFANYRITNELAKRGGADPGWKYMHCLPRYFEEVEDAVFYSPRSKVFEQSANRLWAAVSVIHSFVVKKGDIDM